MKVLKFGGSSVANAENIQKVVSIVLANTEAQVVVVSALGGVTDALIKAGTLAEQTDENYKDILQQLEKKHLDTARALLPVTHQSSCLSMIKQQFNELDEICNSVFYLKELSLRTKDRIISFGELLSSKIIAAFLQTKHANIEWLDSRKVIKTNSNFGFAAVNFQTTNELIANAIPPGKEIFIAPGFIASDENNNTTTLGRGGSDYTAAIYASALDAASLEIWTDVSGMMTAFYAIPGGSFTYIVAPKNYDISKIQNRIHGFIEKNWGKEIADGARLPLQPLTDIHFDPRYLNNTISYTTSRETYYVLAAVAVLIIIIACINFINLATAQAIRRAKEVGVRKVLGSNRSQLIAQFLGETSLMVIVALVLALILTALLLPLLSTWLDIKISITQLLQPAVIALILLSALAVVLLAGLYPAFVQSAFKPIESLKSKATLSFKGLTLRKSLVVIQFAISQIMIVGTLVVAYQMDFFENRNLGFNKDAVISVGIPDQQKTEVLKQQWAQNPGIKQVCFSSGAPVINGNFTSFISPEIGLTKDDVTEMKFIDETYTDMFQLTMLAGNKITHTNKSENDTVYDVVVNETMIHKLGVQDPQKAIGKHIILNGNWYCNIMGVVKDFQSESKHKAIRPCVLMYRADNFYMASVKLAPANMNKTIEAIDKSWSALFPQSVFSYEFLDDHIAEWYRQEEKEYTAFKMFAAVAILIGCLGLYGLVAFAAAQRTKEVGIRKVLGASLTDIVLLFSKEFVLLIAVAFLIAAPVAYYVMNNWLHSFAYQINIGANIFVIAILSSFVIAASTIAYEAIKAAIANPVKSLRTE